MNALAHGALLAAVALAGPAAAQTGVPVEDRIDLVRVDRRLLAVDADGSTLEVDLELGERVLDLRSDGRVGIATTSARLLGVTTRSASWRELRLRVEERAAGPPAIHLGQRVAVVPLTSRLAALGAESSSWQEIELGPRESIDQLLIDANVAVAVTSRRLIGFAVASGGFVEEPLSPQERIEAASHQESSVALTTSRRLLVFRSGALRWVTRARSGGLTDSP